MMDRPSERNRIDHRVFQLSPACLVQLSPAPLFLFGGFGGLIRTSWTWFWVERLQFWGLVGHELPTWLQKL